MVAAGVGIEQAEAGRLVAKVCGDLAEGESKLAELEVVQKNIQTL